MVLDKRDARTGDSGPRRKPLRVAVTEIDQEILRLLVRRHNLLAKMRKNGRLDPGEEKFLREAWQNDVARVSHDADLSGRFFSLMQRVVFLPKPAADDGDTPETRKRAAFNLAPPAAPATLALKAPFSGSQTCAWVYMAAAAGQKARLANCLQNDPIIDCIRGLVQMGGAISREDESIIVREADPLGAPDKVIHAGCGEFTFYLFVAHYLGRHGRVKFTGSRELQLADFSALRRVLPELGGRLVHAVPRSNGLPVRLETSGVLPSGITVQTDFPALFAEALLLAAPFYGTPFAVNLARHPARRNILAHILPILKSVGAVFSLSGDTVSLEPSRLLIPAQPNLPLDPELASFLLALPCALGGEASLEGSWPDWPEADAVWSMVISAGWKRDENSVMAVRSEPLLDFAPEPPPAGEMPLWSKPLIACLAACAALRGGRGVLPPHLVDNADVSDFLSIAGLVPEADGSLRKCEKRDGLAWNVPTPAWAMALAVAAGARADRRGWPLGNPGIVTELWPQFWSLYNSLPNPQLKKREEQPMGQPQKARRRILTTAVAVPPEIREEDWD